MKRSREINNFRLYHCTRVIPDPCTLFWKYVKLEICTCTRYQLFVHNVPCLKSFSTESISKVSLSHFKIQLYRMLNLFIVNITLKYLEICVGKYTLLYYLWLLPDPSLSIGGPLSCLKPIQVHLNYFNVR